MDTSEASKWCGGPASQQVAPRLRRLTHVEPLLPQLDSVVYEYTIPDLSSWTRAVLRGERSRGEPIYRGYKCQADTQGAGSREEQFLKPYEAARLISAVYMRCVDPLRFHTIGEKRPGKEQVFESFARALATSKLREAVDLVSSNLQSLWMVETYQSGTGANTVRWMQYLAGEALQTALLRDDRHAGSGRHALRAALTEIRDSVSVPDRFIALARDRYGSRDATGG